MPPNGCDIFVSYAHVDNDPKPGIDKGWVSTFVDGLRIDLARVLGRPDAYSLWMDYELRGHEPLTAAIHGQLSTAKILLLFLSPGHLTFDWCRQELETFAAQVGADVGRIFPVYVYPVDKLPKPLEDLPMYHFWLDELKGPRTLGDPQPIPTEREYYQGILRLARELAAKLQGIAQPSPTTEGLTVFVNGGELDTELVRATAARLKEKGYGSILSLSVLEDAGGASPTSAEAITRDPRENLELCNAVLLLYRNGPRVQVRQYITEYRKHKARSEAVPKHIHLCQAQPQAEDLGMDFPELHVLCTDEACVDECVEQFLQEPLP